MLKREMTAEEGLQYWMQKKDTTFTCKVFEAIDKADSVQLEKLRSAFPKHVEVFEKAVAKQNPSPSKEEIEYWNLSFNSPVNREG